MEMAKEEEIVIVGGGICGLATALALHRKGIRSVILERSDKLRATGAAIIIQPNGWRALDQLGVASKLRQTAIPILTGQTISLDNGVRKEIPMGDGEVRVLKRRDLMEALAGEIPANTIRFKCQMISIELDPVTSLPVLQLIDGNILKAKVVIGCDGVNSPTANLFGPSSTKLFSTCAVRGWTSYQNGHEYENDFLIISKDGVQLGRMPMTKTLVYWFVTRKWTSYDAMVLNDPVLIRQSTIESLKGFPTDIIDMIKNSDLDSLHLTPIRYRAPWDLLISRFRKGTVTVAGDSMHATGPFLAQGGSASLEDSVVLARRIAQNLPGVELKGKVWKVMVERAIDEYVKERKMRVVRLSTQTYLIGMLLDAKSVFMKLICIVFMSILFRDPVAHTYYDCDRL